MAFDLTNRAWGLSEPMPQSAFLVLLYYAHCINSERPERGAWPAYATTAKATRLSKGSVKRAVPWLREHGYFVFLRNVQHPGSKAWTKAYAVVLPEVKEISPCDFVDSKQPTNGEGSLTDDIKEVSFGVKEVSSFETQIRSRTRTKDNQNANVLSRCESREKQTQPPEYNSFEGLREAFARYAGKSKPSIEGGKAKAKANGNGKPKPIVQDMDARPRDWYQKRRELLKAQAAQLLQAKDVTQKVTTNVPGEGGTAGETQ